MKLLRDLAQLLGGVLALAFTILVFYLLYLTFVWSWDLLLWAAGIAFLGVILLSLAVNVQEARSKRAKRGERGATAHLMLAVLGHVARNLATATLAIAAGVVAAAIFQGAVLSRSDDLYASDLQSYEESLLHAKLWLDRALGLDVLAGVMVLVTALSLFLPLGNLVGRTLSVRRVLTFVYVALLALTSFTFFAGMALKPYELSLRTQLRSRAAHAIDEHRLDWRKDLVAIAWMVGELEDPATPPFPDVAERLNDYLKRGPYYHSELDTAAWQIAGFETVLFFIDDPDRRHGRHEREVDVHAQQYRFEETPSPGLLEDLRFFVARFFGDGFSWAKPDSGAQAWDYLRVLRAIEPPGQARVNAGDSPLAQARTAAIELLSGMLAENIGGAVTGEDLSRHFAGELVQAVVLPLWDVVLPMEIKDLASARRFVATHGLDRAALDWSRLSDIPPLPASEAETAAFDPSTGGPSTGLGSTSPLAVPMSTLPSWQSFGSPAAFVFRPPVGTPQVYTGVGVRFR